MVYRGRLAGGPGPDFREAIIASPGTLLQGDVELHVRSSDFRRHGHDHDHAYDGVVLHVVFHDDEGADTLLAGGRRVPVVVLGDWVEGRAREIRRWLERPVQWREPCSSAVARTSAEDVAASLGRLGDMRFQQKTVAFAKRLRCEDPDELLWEGLLEALGYGGSREAFRLLARRLPWRRLQRELAPLPSGERVMVGQRLLLEAADISVADMLLPPPGRQMRPANRFARRLDGAARLAARLAAGGGIVDVVSGLLVEGNDKGETATDSKAILSRLLGSFTVPGAVGRSRAVELLANAVLPFLAALGPLALTRHAEALYRTLPLPTRYGAVRHLHAAVDADVAINARRQQGMLYLLKQYCTQGGCGRCPLS